MGATGDDTRLMALGMLGRVLDEGAALGEADIAAATESRNRGHARHLVYGVLRWYAALDWLAAQLLQKPLKRKDRDIHRLILLGLFQLWQDDTPPHAAINETTGVARKRGKPWATGLVNAVLRRFQREQDHLLAQLQGCDERFAHPPWLLNALRQDWPEDWESIVAANNQPAPLWLRINESCDAASVTEALRRDGLAVASHPEVPSALSVEPARPVQALPGFEAGRLSVQDPAAQLAALLLDCRPGQRVLDACAAPGGKTGHLLERYPHIELLALDRSSARLQQVHENLERLNLADRAETRAADAARPDTWWDGSPFDRILLDAPCTATGVIRRHPEIKWLRTPQQVDDAVALQAALLDALWPLLRPGGMLLYATCSVLKRENGEQVMAFLEHRSDAVKALHGVEWGRDSGPGRQILPGEREMDGFFYAALHKQA